MTMIHQGNCLDVLRDFEDNTIDTIITDPPYGYSFMNKDWDKAVVPAETWKECLRVLKPGAFAAVMSSPRQDVLSRMIVNLQDVGFRTDFTSIYWTYASGFPKAMNIGKRVEQLNGAYAGFQPKPAVEVILMVMKPLSEKTFVDQVLSNGKGVTWLDSCRIPFQDETDSDKSGWQHYDKNKGLHSWNELKVREGDRKETVLPRSDKIQELEANPQGRFPANLLVSDDVLNDGQVRISKYGKQSQYKSDSESHLTFCNKEEKTISGVNKFVGDSGSYSRYFDLDKWFDTTFPFLAVPKASSSEKNKGLDKWIERQGVRPNSPDPTGKFPDHDHRPTKGNFHPTVKPLKLMSWLVILLTRPKDTVLDPFCGSGTTLLAAQMLKRNWIGIELNKEYVELAEARLGLEKVANNQF